MTRPVHLALATAMTVVAITPFASRAMQTTTVSLDVQFKLTTPDYQPIAGVPVRVTFGAESTWQAPRTGTSFVTDAAGTFRFTAPAPIDAQPKKIPTNFADSLLARPQPADHLLVATELAYLDSPWLYVFDLWRFRNGGDVLKEGLSVYTRDDAGRFTRKARQENGGWVMADLRGLVLTTPGHEPWDYMLEPGPDGATPPKWTLRLAFKRWPAPIRR